MNDSCGNNTPDLQAFGLGALEDDDDEEVYHRDSMSRYDTVIGGEEPGDGLYGWTAPQQYTERRGQCRICTVYMREVRIKARMRRRRLLLWYSQGNAETARTWEGSWRASL